MEAIILDLEYFKPHLLLGENGTQTRRVSVLIGSQLIVTSQAKRVSIRHGDHQAHGSEE